LVFPSIGSWEVPAWISYSTGDVMRGSGINITNGAWRIWAFTASSPSLPLLLFCGTTWLVKLTPRGWNNGMSRDSGGLTVAFVTPTTHVCWPLLLSGMMTCESYSHILLPTYQWRPTEHEPPHPGCTVLSWN